MLNIGIIGAGNFAVRHAQAISEIDGARLTAVCRRDPAALQEFARRFPARTYTDYHDVLRDSNVDAVVIAMPHHLHVEAATAAARAGKHILLEKPMAPTLSGCDLIIEAAQRTGVSLALGHNFRFVPAFAAAKRILDSGELGEIVMGTSTMLKGWIPSKRPPWMLDRRMGGGVMMTAGLHSLDVLVYLVGARVRSVSAAFATRFHAMPGDDTAMLFLRFANGVAGVVKSAGYVSGVTEMHPIQLVCTRGMLAADPIAGTSTGRDEQWQPVEGSTSPTWLQDATLVQWRGFVDALAGRGALPVTGEQARHVMATIFAAEESSATGREVMVSA